MLARSQECNADVIEDFKGTQRPLLLDFEAGDGLGDALQIGSGTDSLNPDGDGCSEGNEIISRTDPLSPTCGGSVFRPCA